MRGDVPISCDSPDDLKTVFPACAGMFQAATDEHSQVVCFPRVRGDVPRSRAARPVWAVFSPRARGCSVRYPIFIGHLFCFPRVRGDVPVLLYQVFVLTKFSPRARGCSQLDQLSNQIADVFPACAGMFLDSKFPSSFTLSFPCVRGDVPTIPKRVPRPFKFSPRARGCSGVA